MQSNVPDPAIERANRDWLFQERMRRGMIEAERLQPTVQIPQEGDRATRSQVDAVLRMPTPEFAEGAGIGGLA